CGVMRTAERAHTALHKVWALPDVNALVHADDVPAAEIRVFDRDIDELAARWARGARERRHEVAFHGPREPGGDLARDAEMTHLVRPVGGDLGLHDRLAGDGRGPRHPRGP